MSSPKVDIRGHPNKSCQQVVVLLTVMFRALGVFPSKTATSSTPHTTAVVAHPVVTDLTVYIFSPTVCPSTCELDPRIWHRIEKELYQYTSQQSAWLYV